MSEKTAKAARKAEKLRGWKMDLRNYIVEVPVFDGDGRPRMKDGKVATDQETIDIQDNLAAMLFHPELKLGPEEMFKAKDLADKIRAANGSVLLDQVEMERIKRSYSLLKGLPERFIEFLTRIRDAEEVSLKEDVPA